MGDIKLKKGTGILFVMAVLFISSLLYLRYGDQNTLRVGIFYGSNWEVPGTVHYEILDQAIKKFKSKYPFRVAFRTDFKGNGTRCVSGIG